MKSISEESEYKLIDSGNGEKLEQFGDVVMRRPDPEVLWRPRENEEIWNRAALSYSRTSDRAGNWKKSSTVPEEWAVRHGDFRFIIRPTSFKHVGLFPEQETNWDFIKEKIKNYTSDEKPKVLNLFAYTGGATLAAVEAGAEVTHVDASKPVVTWASDNAKLNNLADAPVRWIVDDCFDYVKKEVKRGKKYDGIVMDPPAFGHGPNDELWKIEEHFLPLFEECLKLLSDAPLFFIVSGYAAGYSGVAFKNTLLPLIEKYGGEIESSELLIMEDSSRGVYLPAGVTARWFAK